jgi:hypothetical protein
MVRRKEVPVALDDAVMALKAHWAELPGLLDADALSRLTRLVEQLHGATTDRGRSDAWNAVVDLALRDLPEDSVVRRSVARALDDVRLTVSTPHWHALPPLPRATAEPDRPTSDPQDRKPPVETWILEAPAVSAVSMVRRGGDPDQPGLIRLLRPDGRVSLPRFQFARGGEPLPLVLRINELLGADDDPWGVADWWLCPNIWLAGTPAHLIGALDDEVLVAAAVVAVAG